MVTENPSGKSPTVTATDLVSLLMLVSFRLPSLRSVSRRRDEGGTKEERAERDELRRKERVSK